MEVKLKVEGKAIINVIVEFKMSNQCQSLMKIKLNIEVKVKVECKSKVRCQGQGQTCMEVKMNVKFLTLDIMNVKMI